MNETLQAKNRIYFLPTSMTVHCLLCIDRTLSTIHVLDMHGPTTITNSIDSLQSQILEEEELTGLPEDWKWVLYGQDGILSGFNKGEFYPVNEQKDGYPPFVDLTKKLAAALW